MVKTGSLPGKLVDLASLVVDARETHHMSRRCRDPSGDYILKVGQMRELKLEISVKNEGEDAHEATLHVDLPESLSYTGVTTTQVCVPIFFSQFFSDFFSSNFFFSKIFGISDF